MPSVPYLLCLNIITDSDTTPSVPYKHHAELL